MGSVDSKATSYQSSTYGRFSFLIGFLLISVGLPRAEVQSENIFAFGSLGSKSEILTLNKAIAIGLERNPELLGLDYDLQIAQSKLGEFKKSILPGGAIKVSDDISNHLVSYYSTSRYYSGRLSIAQPLYLPGYLVHSKGLWIDVLQVEEEIDSTKKKVRKEVEISFLEVLRIDAILSHKQQLIKDISKFRDKLKHLQAQGYVTKLDLRRMDNEVALLEEEKNEIEDGRKRAIRDLFHILGMDKMDGISRVRFDSGVFSINEIEENRSLDQLLKKASESNFEIRNYRLRERNGILKEEEARRSYSPTVIASMGLGREGSQINNLSPSWAMNVTLDWPIWDWGQRSQRIKQIKLGQNQLLERRREKESEIKNGIELQYSRMNSLRRRHRIENEKVLIEKKAYDVEKLKFANSQSSVNDVVSSLREFDASYAASLQTILNFNRTVSEIQYLVGQPVGD